MMAQPLPSRCRVSRLAQSKLRSSKRYRALPSSGRAIERMIQNTTFAALFIVAAASSICVLVDAFCLPTRTTFVGNQQKATHRQHALTLLKAKKKLSMAQKRKRRGKKLPPRKVERPAVLDRTPAVDSWAPTLTTDESVAKMKEQEDAAAAASAKADAEIQAQAASLIESQRKSVETLTLVKERVEALSYKEMADALKTKGYYVKDDFLGKAELIEEMDQEAIAMMIGDKLDRDVSNLESGEFATSIKGGEEQYVDLPRTVEYIVSSTRHMPPLIEEEMYNALDKCSLDATASTGSLRVFDRKARESSLALLTEAPPPRDFGYANESGDSSDLKKITVLYFLTPSAWDAECGGGVAFEEGGSVEPKRDRLLVLRSDTAHRVEPCVGKDGMDNCAYIVNHLLRKSSDDKQS